MAKAGRHGVFTTTLRGAGIPALLRKGALDTMKGELDSSRDCLRLAKLGADAPPLANAARRYVLNAATFDKICPLVRPAGNSKWRRVKN